MNSLTRCGSLFPSLFFSTCQFIVHYSLCTRSLLTWRYHCIQYIHYAQSFFRYLKNFPHVILKSFCQFFFSGDLCLSLIPLIKVVVECSLNIAHMLPCTTDGDCGKLQVGDRFCNCFQSGHHLIVLPFVVRTKDKKNSKCSRGYK